MITLTMHAPPGTLLMSSGGRASRLRTTALELPGMLLQQCPQTGTISRLLKIWRHLCHKSHYLS